MAESYITRRGSATGGAGSLNIYYGDSPPSDKVGVFCQTSENVGSTVVEAYPMVSGQNNFELYDGYMYNSTANSVNRCIDNSGNIYTIDISTNQLYKYSIQSNTSTSLTTYSPGSAFYWTGSWIYYYNDMIYRSGGYGSSGYNLYFRNYTDVYDINSNIWSYEYKAFQQIINLPISTGVYYNNGISFFLQSNVQSFSGAGRNIVVAKYDANLGVSSAIYSTSIGTSSTDYINSYGWICGTNFLVAFMPENVSSASGFLNIDCESLIVGNWSYGFNNRTYFQNCQGMFFINGNGYFVYGGGNIYQFSSDYTSASLVVVSTQIPTPFFVGGIIGSYATKAYGYQAPSYNNAFSYGQDIPQFDDNTIIVVSGGYGNKAEIISGDNSVEIPVQTSYYYDGTGLTELPTQVRTTGTDWISI